MYEVGLALACRQPSEVLLIRDDREKFLFDVSTIPHMHIDFTDQENAKKLLVDEIVARLRERDHLNDARLRLAVSKLTAQERQLIELFSDYKPNQTFWINRSNLGTLAALPRILDKELMVTAGITEDGQAMFQWTRLGYVVAQNLDHFVPKVSFPEKEGERASDRG